MACVVGCSIENNTPAGLNWRQVHSMNPIRHPEIPLFHWSLACNHCDDAPCMKNCPAKAYSKDSENGLILHHPEACIGCKYCTWACPFDAPKYNPETRIVEKCTFCATRLDNQRLPACVEACPVGALTSTDHHQDEHSILTPGFPDTGVEPAIRFVELRKESAPAIVNLDQVHTSEEQALKWIKKPKTKIDLRKEWVLLLFTLMVPWLAAWLAATVAGYVMISPWAFGAGSLLTLAASTLHLGKKAKAWRAILHVKNSWLSREILSTALFVAFGMVYLIFHVPLSGYLAIFFSLISLISIDLVYAVFERKEKTLINSALVIFTGALYYGLFTNTIFLIGFSLTLKAGLYIFRKLAAPQKETWLAASASIFRMVTLVIPILWLALNLANLISYQLVILLVFAGEFIDRAQFYRESDIIHPAKEIYRHFQNYETKKG